MFNRPPGDLSRREPLIYTAPRLDIWFRSHRSAYGPIFFRKNRAHRWDAPKGDYGVLYLGANERCAFMESIGRGVLRTRLVPGAQVNKCEFSRLQFSRELRLVDLVASGGLTRLGADGSLANGLGYRNSQRWSEALRSHPAKPDGIYYRSRYDPALTACALFDHCQPLVRIIESCGSWADHPVLLGAILDHYQFGTDL
jgi:hypothetical protein